MLDFISDSPWFLLLSIHCLIGAVAALVAQQKGYPLEKWLLYGLIGGTVSLIWAITLKNQE
ncbi:MAG: hypothetical protein QNJ60_02115 [Xenococcaceae cyanobacterium MO_188.B19]|nr:hypothetical protein [Xenococcaceae cyanobacterium MO_188.B19]